MTTAPAPAGKASARIFVLLLVILILAGARMAPAFDFQDLMLMPVGRPLPEFVLTPIDDNEPGFSSAELAGQVALLNVFASWCAPCREEHAVLLDLADRGVPLYGLNYKDAPAAARRWLTTLGNPYLRTGADRDGSVANRLELRGLPQTVVVDRSGRIAFVHVGAMTDSDMRDIILPLIATLRDRAS
jgi:cytochrome c biogenesis protein CcmG/thiol:disulfide interchange protein DsbE